MDSIYEQIIEWQAHWAARELKMPEGLFRRTVRKFIGSDESLVNFLSDFFFVTNRAVEIRLNEFRLWGEQKDARVYEMLADGNRTESLQGADADMEMIVNTDERGRVGSCLRCGNTDFASEALFCKRCGLDLINYCTYERCEHANTPDAAYCERCGAETTFFVKGVVNDWQGPYQDPGANNVNSENLEDLLPF